MSKTPSVEAFTIAEAIQDNWTVGNWEDQYPGYDWKPARTKDIAATIDSIGTSAGEKASLQALADTLTQAVKDAMSEIVSDIRQSMAGKKVKDFYSVNELANAMGKSPYTVREQYCNYGRIECVKDASGKWLIPGKEYLRLINGGPLKPATKLSEK